MKKGEFKYREDSRDSEFVRHQKKCWSHGIVIVPVPTVSKYCKIAVLKNNRVDIMGKEYYSQYPTSGGSPLNKKIEELYEYFYEKIVKEEKVKSRIAS